MNPLEIRYQALGLVGDCRQRFDGGRELVAVANHGGKIRGRLIVVFFRRYAGQGVLEIKVQVEMKLIIDAHRLYFRIGRAKTYGREKPRCLKQAAEFVGRIVVVHPAPDTIPQVGFAQGRTTIKCSFGDSRYRRHPERNDRIRRPRFLQVDVPGSGKRIGRFEKRERRFALVGKIKSVDEENAFEAVRMAGVAVGTTRQPVNEVAAGAAFDNFAGYGIRAGDLVKVGGGD